MPKSLTLPPSNSSLDAFFSEETQQSEIRQQKFNLDGIIENLLNYNSLSSDLNTSIRYIPPFSTLLLLIM